MLSKVIFSTPILYLWNAEFRRRQAAAKRLRERAGERVMSGPFTGLHYLGRSIGSTFGPKILGTYEKELWDLIERITRENYGTFVDIGAAEGYYAVGLAKRLPAAKVICFEAQTKEHPLLRQLAAMNGVSERITIQGWCTPVSLNDTLRTSVGRCLVMCDAEGAEADLLDVALVPPLAGADILVEVHDFIRPGVSNVLMERFSQSHQVERIRTRPRSVEDWPDGIEGDAQWKLDLLDECRPAPMEWFWMTPRAL